MKKNRLSSALSSIVLLTYSVLAANTLLHAAPASGITPATTVNSDDAEMEQSGDFDQLDGIRDEAQASSASAPTYDDVPVDAIRRFVSIYEKVKANYVEPVDDNELFENALHGLLSKLDPYSDYLDAKTYEALLDFTEGEVAQTGLTVRPLTGADANWQIDQVDSGSPAARAGLQEGMLLYRIDGKSTRNLSQHDIDQLLRGAVGTTVELSVAESGKHSRNVRVIRATPEDNAVKVIEEPNGILVLKVSAFQSQTASQINQAIETYQKNTPLKAVLLDLRDNPGGLLSAAVEVADLFLNQGLIVYTKGRGEPEQRYQAVPPARYAQLPIGILVNHYSASAAEVLAGAFQDHQRAIVIGETSYGKGSVQKLWPIADGYAIKLTVARYYTPKGRLIEGKGIQPDILIKDQLSTNDIDNTLNSGVTMLRKYYQLP
ncbi:S41 family peptidase [Alkanindiges illinoisensis]|uniref:S41 family peptidase n=1 Tax=Alkanindiges illinoisensis TaxID=197183 RepID=UPI00068402A1|nr:S41 family peptidase [Alkanindiges illinoisensis]